ncbi:14771_t:CDS:1 [Funneliformis geosporum]|uniref:ubiquitinyl hydrolase 1 n=1 Tax=Funneliformis geosporum TaxID=1117311 RepID=A0A9W4SS79_9GLOM|nr:14771_t:CDS:1 [Funneliformis geosporum]CAI2178989.1 9702_t:CDS:1 [Funneliformis geosporum]
METSNLVTASLVVTTILIITPFFVTPKTKESKRKKKNNLNKEIEIKTYTFGLINQGNNICFLNSVLQSLASLKGLRKYLEKKVESNPSDTTRPVTFALHVTLERLNEPLTKQQSFIATDVVLALQANARRLINRQQQDAHELFQLLIQSLGAEEDYERRPKSLLDLELIRKLAAEKDKIKHFVSERNPLRGLTACRVSCMKCGYCGPIRHITFDNISIPLPGLSSVPLDVLLRTYAGTDFIDEYNCPHCSLIETLASIENALEDTKREPSDKGNESKLENDRQVVKKALATDVDTDISNQLQLTKLAHVKSTASKHTMFAKLPDVFAIHFSRSIYYQSGWTLKNPCKVKFSDSIDMMKYISGGYLANMPSEPMSSPPSPILSSPMSSPILAGIGASSRRNDIPCESGNIYMLKSVIVHQGDHRSGHFVTYRRKEDSDIWWRLSDEYVEEVKLKQVLNEEAYMLFYEKAQQ